MKYKIGDKVRVKKDIISGSEIIKKGEVGEVKELISTIDAYVVHFTEDGNAIVFEKNLEKA